MLKKYCITAAVALPPRLAGQGSHFFKESHLRHVRRVSLHDNTHGREAQVSRQQCKEMYA